MLVAFARATSGRARAGFIAASTLAIALIAATVIAVLPWWTAWLRGLTGFTATPPSRTTTLSTTLDALLGPAGAIVLVAIIATAILVGLTLPARRPATLAMWIATATLIAPYVQTVLPLPATSSADRGTTCRCAINVETLPVTCSSRRSRPGGRRSDSSWVPSRRLSPRHNPMLNGPTTAIRFD